MFKCETFLAGLGGGIGGSYASNVAGRVYTADEGFGGGGIREDDVLLDDKGGFEGIFAYP